MCELVARTDHAIGLRVLLASVSLSLAVPLAVPLAGAQPAVPQGWSTQTVGGAMLLVAAASDSSPRVTVTLLPPGRPRGDDKMWFANQVLSLAEGLGRPSSASDVKERNGLLGRVIEMETPQHVALMFYGYPTANGVSVAVLSIPAGVDAKDRRVQVANDYVHQVALQKFELPPWPAAVSPNAASQAPARNGRGQYVGALGRTDIDLTYHGKAIPSKDRDVPLKGIYLFAGVAFGATGGGLGTTMTYGQHAVQQLLLLYANGVAARFDALGNNIAGYHQAEGFATLDVSDPTTLTGRPFGHWTDDSSAIHIQWNGGASSELAKNGAALEAKGERWTPYVLADGQVLEGTFVRQLEAGLRSEWMVLKKDGTFTGDGLSVALGGSAMNPSFPEHGSGHYEIRKGSMIFFFDNGYTQAIACVLAPLSGEVKTVLLNDFPFQRAR